MGKTTFSFFTARAWRRGRRTAGAIALFTGALALNGCIGGPEVPWRPRSAEIDRAWATVPTAGRQPDCSVALYGDSILHGAHNGAHRLAEPPAAILRRLRPRYAVVDRTIPGDSAYAHVSQFMHTPLGSRIVVLQYGINDAGHSYPYEPALQTMVAHVRSQGRTPLVTGLSRTSEGVPQRDAYDAVARRVAHEQRVVFADWGAVRFDRADMADPVHPGPLYAERLVVQLVRALDAIAPECTGGDTLLYSVVRNS